MITMEPYTSLMLRWIIRYLILSSMWTIVVTSNGESKKIETVSCADPLTYRELGLPIPKSCLPTEPVLGYQNLPKDKCEGLFGDNQIIVPPRSNCVMTKIVLEFHIIEVLRKDNLTEYIRDLETLHLQSVHRFHKFEPGVFRNGLELRSISVADAPKLTTIDDEVFQEELPKLQTIRITRSGLLTLPYLGNLTGILDIVDFGYNLIGRIEANRCTNINVDLLALEYNKISFVDSKVFQGSRIKTLKLKGNKELKNITEDAFVGLKVLRALDLSETSITVLPTKGLANIENITIEDTETLKTFPSVAIFESITLAKLTYPYHCCAFSYPELQDPEGYQKFLDKKAAYKEKCLWALRNLENPNNRSTPSPRSDSSRVNNTPHLEHQPDVKFFAACVDRDEPFRNVTCIPEPDAFNPCEDIMGNWVLRVSVWLVAILAIVGNLAVLIVLIAKIQMTVPKFLMCNLSFADLCMGIYLILMADRDARSIGAYFNHAIEWQNGIGCQIAGFLSVFSTQLSIFTLAVITMERWYTIIYAIMNRRLRLKTCVKIMAAGWVYACIMALLPIFGVSGYSTTSICLPLKHRNTFDLLYLIMLFAFSVIAFVLIVACYGSMYSSIRVGHRTSVTSKDHSDKTIARRMALLVFADFACWAPIAFFSFTTLVSSERLISMTLLKILVVFFYPFNSCVNPYLYALLTHQYRRDFFALLAQCGMCKSRAARYNFETCGLPLENRPSDHNTRDDSATNDTKKKCTTYLKMQNGIHNILRRTAK